METLLQERYEQLIQRGYAHFEAEYLAEIWILRDCGKQLESSELEALNQALLCPSL